MYPPVWTWSIHICVRSVVRAATGLSELSASRPSSPGRHSPVRLVRSPSRRDRSPSSCQDCKPDRSPRQCWLVWPAGGSLCPPSRGRVPSLPPSLLCGLVPDGLTLATIFLRTVFFLTHVLSFLLPSPPPPDCWSSVLSSWILPRADQRERTREGEVSARAHTSAHLQAWLAS